VKILVLLAAFLALPASAQNLRATFESQLLQNQLADRENLTRLTEKELPVYIQRKLLVPLPKNQYVVVDYRLPARYRWCRPWVREWLLELGREYYKEFRRPLQVNAAVRTVEYQARLTKRNGNAAPPAGPRRSSHLTGSTVDLGKLRMSDAEMKWMRERLHDHREKRRVIPVEEFGQAVFHTMVVRPH
jgi:hypothetical protein